MITVLFHGNRYHQAVVCPTCHAILQFEEADKITTMPWTYKKFQHNFNKPDARVTPYIVCPECRHKITFDIPKKIQQNTDNDKEGNE